MTNGREKGARGERELARKLREYGYHSRRGQQYSGANGDADVVGLFGIQTGSYTNRDGQKVYTTDVVVEEHEFAESKASASQNSGSNYGGYNNYSQETRQTDPERASSVGDGFMSIPDDVDDEGLPFD